MKHKEIYYSYCARGILNLEENYCGIVVLVGKNPISKRNFRGNVYFPIYRSGESYRAELEEAKKGRREMNRKGLEIMAGEVIRFLDGKSGNVRLNLDVSFTDDYANEEARRDRDRELLALIENVGIAGE
jgi:hypothetical protein